MAEPWYRDGLQFTCTRCGNCCTGAPGYVWVTAEEVAALAEAREVTPEQFRAMYTRKAQGKYTLRERENGDCVFWEPEKGCTVYEQRPMQCRTWPFWSSNLKSRAEWSRVQEGCPGAGQGELHPLEEIQRRIQLIVI